MRNSLIVLTVVVSMLLAVSCARPNHKAVKITVEPQSGIDFEKYKNVYYAGFYIKREGKKTDSKDVTDNFFLKELPKALALEIKRLPSAPEWQNGKKEFRDLREQYPDSLIISGMATIKESSKSVIRKIKDKDGNKKKQFVETKAETIKSTVVIFDTRTGRKIFSRKFTNKLSGKELGEKDFNLKALFENNMDKFIRNLLKRPGRETRYIIYK